jgi:chromate transporter
VSLPRPAGGRRRELLRLFLRLGATSFGGPAAHIALLRREVVQRRRWLGDDEFLDLMGASNVLPGPTSTEVALYVGRRRAGTVGLLLAGLGFILPAALVVVVLAWAYVRYGTTPAAEDLLYGMKPVVVAVVAGAVLGLGRTAVKSVTLGVLGAAVLILYLFGVTEPVLLFGAAAAAAVALGPTGARRWPMVAVVGVPPVPDVGLVDLAGVFLKIGALLFGSGYVLFAFLERDLVEVRAWLTEAQVLDAVAVGQLTPGPVFTTATFVGYLLAGLPGAVVATVAIFLPSFAFVAALDPLVSRLRRSPTAAAAMDGLNVAAVAVMAGVTWRLARDAIVDVETALVALAAAVVLVRTAVNPAWLLLAGAVLGLVLQA